MVSNWRRQAWEPATAERPQVNTALLNAPSQMPPTALAENSFSSSGVPLDFSFIPVAAQYHWPSVWVHPAKSKVHGMPCWSTSLEPSPVCTWMQPPGIPSSTAPVKPFQTLFKVSPPSTMQLYLQFAAIFFQLSPLQCSIRTELSSTHFCTVSPALVHSQTSTELVTSRAEWAWAHSHFSDRRLATEGWELQSGRNIWTAGGKSHPVKVLGSRKPQHCLHSLAV